MDQESHHISKNIPLLIEAGQEVHSVTVAHRERTYSDELYCRLSAVLLKGLLGCYVYGSVHC